MKFWGIIVFLSLQICFADVKGTQGVIQFDVQSDGQKEMTLNSTGLGIGTTPSTNLHVQGNAIVSEKLLIGTISGSSNLTLNGTLGYGTQSINSNTTLGNYSTVFVDSSSDNITITLPYAGNVEGRIYKIKKINTSNEVWIFGGGNLIDNTSPLVLPSASLASVSVISDGSNWHSINTYQSESTVAADNLIAWWDFDNISDNILTDLSASGYDGSLTGLASSNIGVDGVLNQAIHFDGENDTANMGNVLNFGANQSFTISMWFKTSVDASGEQWVTMLAKEDWNDTPRQGLEVFLHASGFSTDNFFGFKVWSNGSQDSVNTSVAVNDGNWHHMVMIRDCDQGFLRVYQNGNLLGTDASISTGSLENGIDFKLAHRPAGATNDYYINVTLDDIRIFNRALTAAESKALFDASPAP